MAYFSYRARSNEGKIINGMVEAPTNFAAAKLLRDKQLFIISLTEAKQNATFSQISVYFQRVKFSDIVNFTRQISTMIVAGLQLPEALNVLLAQTKNPLMAQILIDIEHHVVSGGNLADALSKYPKYFSGIYVSLVRAGETSGNLDKILVRLAETLEAEQEFRSKVKGAMIYPAIIVIGMIIVIIVMMTVVVPKLSDLYKDFNVSLPWSTQILISLSDFLVKYLIFLIPIVFVVIYVFNHWRKTTVGQFVMDTIILRVPIFGELQKKMILVDFTQTLGMLISSGIHILDGLRILQGSLGNVIFQNAIFEIALKVEKGFSLGDSFAQHEVFPPIVSQMIRVGEETGKLDDTLIKLSQYFQSESEHLVKGLTTAIEPIIMVVLGVGVGFIVISIITPIYSLTNSFR